MIIGPCYPGAIGIGAVCSANRLPIACLSGPGPFRKSTLRVVRYLKRYRSIFQIAAADFLLFLLIRNRQSIVVRRKIIGIQFCCCILDAAVNGEVLREGYVQLCQPIIVFSSL